MIQYQWITRWYPAGWRLGILRLVFLGGLAYGEDGVIPGLEILTTRQPELIAGKRVAIIANPTSVDRHGRSTVERIAEHAQISALFAPEHGLQGTEEAGASIAPSAWKDVPVFSLYGKFKTPTRRMLKDTDVLVYDIQDVGARFYTYISTLFLALSAAKREGIPVIVLDRPNPINATLVEGPVTNPVYSSFVGALPLTIRYGLTAGETARMMNEETCAGFSLGAHLTVVPMEGYRRSMWYDETGIPWIAPSPNMPTLETAIVYPGLCLLEGTNLSEGRGTSAPFLTVGAPFLDAKKWWAAVPDRWRAGIEADVVSFTPVKIPGKAENPKFTGQTCQGLRLRVTGRDALRPVGLAVALLCAARDLEPKQFQVHASMDRLWGNENLRALLEEGADCGTILDTAQPDCAYFENIRQKYFIYR
ncbi:MAG: DUF1343 domain-containing protein [Candidatus Omnitrophica bacterium]|nr:DUF1343 domain-containing protein [Candidatus Omnitrophota bacterium]